jgi:hypothetical protein
MVGTMANENDFDFLEFSTNIIKTVDGIRSTGRKGSKNPIEYRINAFYRAIGLPGVMGILDEETRLQYDKKNNSNMLDGGGELNVIDPIFIKLKQRESLSNSIRSTQDDEVIKNSLDINSNSILSSIEEDPRNQVRPCLFPMYVDASIEIFPKERRVAGAFCSDEQLKDDKIRYQRPLIETIISLKLNFAGITDTTKRPSDNELIMFSEFNKLAEDTKEILRKSFYTIDDTLIKIKEKVEAAKKQSNVYISPDTLGGNTQKIQEQEEKLQAGLDLARNKLDLELQVKRSKLILFDFDDSRKEKANKTRNMKDVLFGSDLLSVVSGESGTIEELSTEVDAKIDKQRRVLKQSFRDLDLILGIYSGLSGTDALAIIYALLSLDEDTLIALLNPASRTRLKKNTGVDLLPFYDTKSAVAKLEQMVRETLNDSWKIMQATVEEKQQNRNTKK